MGIGDGRIGHGDRNVGIAARPAVHIVERNLIEADQQPAAEADEHDASERRDFPVRAICGLAAAPARWRESRAW